MKPSSKPNYSILLRNDKGSNHILHSRGERFPEYELVVSISFEDHPVSVTLGKLQEGLANNFFSLTSLSMTRSLFKTMPCKLIFNFYFPSWWKDILA